ncbi:hypothetical protein DB345_17195 [Spartobacteria bacterium LR76]|nr:hypothetical protein DB345_17195 [Spartobacteria bacterium LR76]
MTASTMADDQHLAERAERAKKIIENAANFKICEGCDSIVTMRVSSCPNCHGYRFNEDTEEVIAHARELGSRAQTTVTSQDLE